MTARALPKPEVTVLAGTAGVPAGGRLVLLALGPATVNGHAIGIHDLLDLDGAAEVRGEGRVLAVRLFA